MIRSNVKPVSILLIILMLSFTIPYHSVLAAMIGTQATLDSMRTQQVRDDINNLLMRKDVQSALMAQGINPIEAKARIDSLSDVEVARLAGQIDKFPAGGYTSVFIGGVIITVIIIVWYAIIVLLVRATDN